MTIKECIDLVDSSKPNQYTTREKVMWLSFLDGTIINDVLKTHEGYDGRYDLFEGYSEDKLTTELIVPSPYDRLYPQYLKMKIDGENGEIVRYNNSAALYNTYLSEFKKWYNKTHMPISGAVMGGAKNDIGSCGCQSNADIAEKAAISAEEARQSAVRASDKAEEARVSAVRAESARVSADNTKHQVDAVSGDVYRMASATREAADEVFATAGSFGEAEARRVSAEALRKQAEAQRVNAENARVKQMTDLTQKVEEALSGAGGSSGGGGFRKIGFTEDCDFAATAEDGLTAFRNAVEAASDGETFFVMSGTYIGSGTLTIAKNVNFVGIGMPTIEFPISVYGEGEYEFGGGIITPIVTYTTNWSGIHFTNTVEGFQAQNYMSPLAYSAVNSDNCIFEGLRNRFVGNHFQSKLIFECAEDYGSLSLGSGFEPAEGCVFESCDLIFRNHFTDFIKAENCNIFFEMNNIYNRECSYIFKNCNVYNYGGNVLTNGQYVETFIVKNCNIFGDKFYSSATESGNHLFSGTAL